MKIILSGYFHHWFGLALSFLVLGLALTGFICNELAQSILPFSVFKRMGLAFKSILLVISAALGFFLFLLFLVQVIGWDPSIMGFPTGIPTISLSDPKSQDARKKQIALEWPQTQQQMWEEKDFIVHSFHQQQSTFQRRSRSGSTLSLKQVLHSIPLVSWFGFTSGSAIEGGQRWILSCEGCFYSVGLCRRFLRSTGVPERHCGSLGAGEWGFEVVGWLGQSEARLGTGDANVNEVRVSHFIGYINDQKYPEGTCTWKRISSTSHE